MAGKKPIGYGARIRRARREAGLTQTQLAEGIGVHERRISVYEREVNAPSPEQMEAIASALRKPVAWFYEKDGEAPDLMAALAELPAVARRLEERMEEFDTRLGARLADFDARVDALLRAQGLDDERIARIKRAIQPPPSTHLP